MKSQFDAIEKQSSDSRKLDTLKQSEQCRDRAHKDRRSATPEPRGRRRAKRGRPAGNGERGFYDAQDKFESANETITTLNSERHQLNQSIEANGKELSEFENKASTEYNAAFRSHQLKIAALKLAVVVPLLFFSAWLVRRKRGSMYQPFHWAALCSTFWMTWLVMWDHFPRDFFKYIAILAAILILGAFLVWAIRSATRPRRDIVIRRHREAYQNHRCPV